MQRAFPIHIIVGNKQTQFWFIKKLAEELKVEDENKVSIENHWKASWA